MHAKIAGHVACGNYTEYYSCYRVENALPAEGRRNCLQWRQIIHSWNIDNVNPFSKECHDTCLFVSRVFLEIYFANVHKEQIILSHEKAELTGQTTATRLTWP